MPEPSKCPNRPKASTAKNTQAIQMPKPPIPPRPPVLPKPHKPPRRSDRPNTRTAQTPKQPVPSKPPKRPGHRSYPNRPDRLSHPYHPNAQAARPYDETTCPNAQPPRPELPERTEYPDFPTLPPPCPPSPTPPPLERSTDSQRKSRTPKANLSPSRKTARIDRNQALPGNCQGGGIKRTVPPLASKSPPI